MGLKLRRTMAAGAASVLGLTLLAACGGDDDGDGNDRAAVTSRVPQAAR